MLHICNKKLMFAFLITVGVENMNHYEAYQEVLEGGLRLTLKYLKFLFLGPPRSGKTSMRRRLVQEIINLSELGQPSKSTGVAETNDVLVKKLVSESAVITDSTWQSLKMCKGERSEIDPVGKEADITYLAQLFYQLISTTTPSSTSTTIITTPTSTEKNDTSSGIKREVKSNQSRKANKLYDSEEMEIKKAFEKLTTILRSDTPEELRKLLEDLTMINMVDVGGQPALLEMLPAFTIGPALYFLFFRLDQELEKRYPVRFHAADSEKETTLDSSYCIEDTLYQALSSIACFGCHSRNESASSRVLLFGTYKDKASSLQISQANDMLQKRLVKTKLYEESLVLKAKRNSLFFPVDNMNGDEKEMLEIRSDIEGIIKEHFSATDIPASWLMFRIVLHLLHKPILGLAQCQAIAKRLSMPTPVQEALWFFHHNIGSILYYSDVPSMKDTVICDPQVIFDSVSKLIIDRFKYKNRSLSSKEVDDFYEKGQFSLAQIKDDTEQQPSNPLTVDQLVDLLKDLNVLAEIALDQKVSGSDQPHRKFIMPAVLKFASEKDLQQLSSGQLISVPLMIKFKGGFVPFGIFCSSIAHLIAHQDSLLPKWRLCNDQVMRNKISFNIDMAFQATLVSQPQCIKIQVSKHPRARSKKSLSTICSIVRKTIVETLERVISKMKYKPYMLGTPSFSSEKPFDLAFKCCLDDSHSDHLMIVVEDEGESCAECPSDKFVFELDKEHLVWFGMVSFTINGPLPMSQKNVHTYVTSCLGCYLVCVRPLSPYISVANVAKYIALAAGLLTKYPIQQISAKVQSFLTWCKLSCPLKMIVCKATAHAV